MISPLITHHESTLVLSPAYYGSISRFAAIASYGKVIVDTNGKFDKRLKSTHRMDIADVNGRMQLTLPVVKPQSMTRSHWNDIEVSNHGEWWHVHRVALESAYGRTPFFEFYIDRFIPFLSRDTVLRYVSLTELDAAIETEICHILGIEPPTCDEPLPAEFVDMRRVDSQSIPVPEYYQVRMSTHGFIPDLSVLDLIFNMGPESPLILKKMI